VRNETTNSKRKVNEMLTVMIHSENAAFDDSQGVRNDECARILRSIADSLEKGRDSGDCIDFQGNTVGSWGINADARVYLRVSPNGDSLSSSRVNRKDLERRLGGDELKSWLDMCESRGKVGECGEFFDDVIVMVG